MRKCLTRNDTFYLNYPYIEQEQEKLLTKHRLAFSWDSKILFQLCQKYTHPDSIDGNMSRKYFALLISSCKYCKY